MSSESDNEAELVAHPEPAHSQARPRRNVTNEIKKSCSILCLPEHLAAYMEERELDRNIEPIDCNKDLIEQIFSNYVIVKNILSHLSWQEKLIAKDVCQLWNSVNKSLQNEQLKPVDFSFHLGFQCDFSPKAKRREVGMYKSSQFYTEPMAIFVFFNTPNTFALGCDEIVPSPCSPPCDKKHCILDVIFQNTTAPYDCMYAVKASSVSYFPLRHSLTAHNMISKPPRRAESFFCGIYIPKIPGVEFRILNAIDAEDVHTKLIPEIKKLTANHIVKGVITCLTENYLLYVDENNAESLEFLHTMQPNIPFAYGGCVVEDASNMTHDMAAMVDSVNNDKSYISGIIMSLGLFVVPKVDNNIPDSSTATNAKHNFEIYSHIIESVDWAKSDVQKTIQEFSKQVPRFEYSAALKFSCVGRQRRHEAEQSAFRSVFPNTCIAGVFGNGELGINHPRRPLRALTTCKRPREDQPYQRVHAYSTVFFYIGWGKITEEAEYD